ncbi:MAG: leucine-rich repeat protein [bacterium]|nr:leucine-rich repeat protein [bacterium]
MKKVLISVLLLISIGSTVVLGAEDNSASKTIVTNMEDIATTEQPEETKVPMVTDEPEGTKVPMATDEPEGTEVPMIAEEPEKTAVPTRTNTPLNTYRSDFEHEIYDGMYILYSVDKDGSAIFEGVDVDLSDKNKSKLVIPEKLGGHTVKTIESIFPYDHGSQKIYLSPIFKNIKEIKLPETLESIEDSAFFYLVNLEKMNLPEGLVKLGSYLPYKNYDKVVLPKSLKKIGTAVFASSNIKEIELPEGLEEIGKMAFSRSKLEKISLPDSVKIVGKEAFDSIYLKEVRIPDSLKNYDGLKKAFSSNFLEKITYSGELTEVMKDAFFYTPFMRNYVATHEANGMLIKDGVLVLYGGYDTNAAIPEGVTEIGYEAFYNTNVKTVQFPSTLTKIGMRAFSKTKLKEVYFPSNVLTIGPSAFYECGELEKAEFEDKGQRVSLGDSAFDVCARLDVIILPKNYNVSSFGISDAALKAVENGKNAPRSTAKPIDADKTESTAAPAETPKPEKIGAFEVSGTGENINITIDGEAIPFRVDKPFIDESDRTQVPVRAIMEHLGCNVVYDDTEKTVEIAKLGTYILLTIGSEDMQLNGENIKMDTSARIVNDRTYIPVRFVAEVLGYEVSYKN